MSEATAQTLSLGVPPRRARRWALPRSPFLAFNILLLGFFIVGLLYPLGLSIVRVFYHDGAIDLSGFT
ncbi:MAG TPA: hypothetical protein VFE52_06140, partial [Devosia sp.]|nr:hypothetical protein [Devosia sp.]